MAHKNGHHVESLAGGGKLKGVLRLVSGSLRRAEVYWYEGHGVGKKGLKIKRFLDSPS